MILIMLVPRLVYTAGMDIHDLTVIIIASHTQFTLITIGLDTILLHTIVVIEIDIDINRV